MERLGVRLSRALAVRRIHFRDEIFFAAPSFKYFKNQEFRASDDPCFVAASVTGQECAQQCEHCRGVLLKSMHKTTTPTELLDFASDLKARGGQGMLVSGGSMKDGKVPLDDFLDVIAEIRNTLGFSLAVHTGIADEKLAKGLKKAGVDIVMVDVVGDRTTASEVLHLDDGPERFEHSLRVLTEAGLDVVPHIVAGLYYGNLRGEKEALKRIAKFPVHSVVLVIARPEPGTPFSHISPPRTESVAELMGEMRLGLPKTALFLGCARPVGRFSREVERLSVLSGFNGIAFPADATVRFSRALGLRPKFAERCCAIYDKPTFSKQ